MSKPPMPDAVTPSGTGLASVPALGGFCVYSVPLAASTTNSVVLAVPAKALV